MRYEGGHLRSMEEKDLDMVLAWRNAPDVRMNMYTTHIISIEEHRRWFESLSQDDSRRYFIFEKHGHPSGVVAFTDINNESGTASWAFYSGDVAARGVGSLMEFYALDYAFETLKLNKLCCEVISFNKSVLGFHRKHGFEVEGIMRRQYFRSGEYHDIYHLAIFKDNWLKRVRPVFVSGERLPFPVNTKYQEYLDVSEDDIARFAHETGDLNEIHLNRSAAIGSGFENVIAHGQYVVSRIMAVIGMKFPGHGTVLLSQRFSFLNPVYSGTRVGLFFKVLSRIGRKMLIEVVVGDDAGRLFVTGEVEVLLTVKN